MSNRIKQVIQTDRAPRAIGIYSQAIKAKNLVFLSGQIPLDPMTMELVSGDIETQIIQVFKNLAAVTHEAGGDLTNIVRLGIYLTDLSYFPHVNRIMAEYFSEPYPARSTIEVSALPKGAAVEMDAIMVLPE